MLGNFEIFAVCCLIREKEFLNIKPNIITNIRIKNLVGSITNPTQWQSQK